MFLVCGYPSIERTPTEWRLPTAYNLQISQSRQRHLGLLGTDAPRGRACVIFCAGRGWEERGDESAKRGMRGWVGAHRGGLTPKLGPLHPAELWAAAIVVVATP